MTRHFRPLLGPNLPVLLRKPGQSLIPRFVAWSSMVTPSVELHEYVPVLLHLQQFLIRRQVRYPPYGPWEHVPAHVWTAPTQEDNDDEDVVGDDGDVCALCCTKFGPEKMSMCDKCELQYCTDRIDTHTCDNVTFL